MQYSVVVTTPESYQLASLEFFPRGEELRVRSGGFIGWGLFLVLSILFEIFAIQYLFDMMMGSCLEPCTPVFRFPLAWIPEYTFPLWYPVVPLLIVRNRRARWVAIGRRGVGIYTGFQYITVEWVHMKGPTEVHWRSRWLQWVRWEWTTPYSSRYFSRSIPLSVDQSRSILLHPSCPVRDLPESVRIGLGFREDWIQQRS